MLVIEPTDYGPVLRFKKGEQGALLALDDANKDRILPQFVFPPLSDRDVEKNRKLRLEEYSRVQVGRILHYWGRRPCVVDLRFVTFAEDQDEDAKRVQEFLALSAEFGCGVLPLVDLDTSESRLAAVRSHWHAAQNGLALRVTLRDLAIAKLASTIQSRLLNLTAKPSQTLLVLDLTDADLNDHEAFAAFSHEWIVRLQEAGLWRRIVLQATHYPSANPAPKNDEIKVERNEWKAWRHLHELNPRIQETLMFGDFGADNAIMNFGRGGLPIKHLRYTISDQWLVVRGGSKDDGEAGSIRSVARRIVKSGYYAGELFSAGDEFIAACASGLGGSGNPSDWRKANMNHHMTRVTFDLGELNARPLVQTQTRRRALQDDLFAAPMDVDGRDKPSHDETIG